MSRNQTPTRGLHGRMVPEDAMDEAKVSRNLAHGEGARSRTCSIDKEIGATLDSPRHRHRPARHWSEEQGSADGRGGDDNGGNGLGDEDDDQMDTDGNGGDDDGGNELGDHGSLIQGDGHGKRARNAASGELPPVKKVRMGADGISRRIELSHYSEGRPSPFRSLFQFNGLSHGNQTPTGGTSPSGSVGITPARTRGAPTEAQWGDGSEEEEDENLRGGGQSQGDAPDTDKDTPPSTWGHAQEHGECPISKGHVKKTTKGASALAKESKKKKPRVRPKGSKSGRGEASGAVPKNASRGSELFVKALAACGKAYRGGRPRHQAGESALIHKMSYHVYVEAVRDAKLMETLKEAGALHKSILLTEVPFEDLKSFSAAMDTLGYIQSEEFVFHDLSYELQANEHPNARHTLASLEQVVQVAASDTGKSLNGLDFSGACLKKNALLDSFEFLKKVWAVTRNARHEVDEFPQSVVEWALASTEGAHHGCHIDGNGFGTVVCPVYGCKLWVLGELPEEKRGVPGYLADLECGEDDEVEWEPILLNPGTALIMAPNTVHAVFSMGPCVFQGWHFYHPRFLSESLVGMAAAILTPNVTNTDHLRLSLEILCRLCTFYRWIYTGERLSESFWGEDLPNANDWECVKDAVSLAVFARSLPHFVPGCDASTLSDVGLQLIDTLTASVRIVVNSGGKRGTASIKEAVYCPYLFNVVTMACEHHPSQTLQALSDKIPEVESADKGVLTRKGEGLVFPFDSTYFTVLKVH
ncbi:hypothetical protein ONZ45_g10812 [Pleurotus djamor]|nr:hypothetical protein ONZ45_g10812 [Pleurotus djamor]